MMSRSIKAVSNSEQTQPYQPDYEPCTLTTDQKERLKQTFDPLTANSEVERVARNIARAVNNPQTPEIVRQHIRAYLSHHFYFDLTQHTEAIKALFPVMCTMLSQVPFVPESDLIEALTGPDKQLAITKAEEDEEHRRHRSMTLEKVSEMVEGVLSEIDEGVDEAAGEMIKLIQAIGLENDPEHRKRMVKVACRCAYAQTDEHRGRERDFIEQAMMERIAS